MLNRGTWHNDVIGGCPLDGWARVYVCVCVRVYVCVCVRVYVCVSDTYVSM